MVNVLPLEITQILFAFIEEEISLNELGQWLYQETRLELILSADDYLKLIALDFQNQKKDSYWQHEIKKTVSEILDSYANIDEYESEKLKNLLNDFLQRKDDLATLLIEFYDYYCHGYRFLKVLGLDYGGKIACYLDEIKYNSGNFFPKSYIREDIVKFIQTEIEQKLPEIDKEVKKVLVWLASGEIKIFIEKSEDFNEYYYGELNGLYYLNYIDCRKE